VIYYFVIEVITNWDVVYCVYSEFTNT